MEGALHIISELQDDGRFRNLAKAMINRLDLAQLLSDQEADGIAFDYEQLQGLREGTI